MSTKLRDGTGPFKNNSGDTVGSLHVTDNGDYGTLTYNDGGTLSLYYPNPPCPENPDHCGYLIGQGPHPQDRLIFQCIQTNIDGQCIKWYWYKEREYSDGSGGWVWHGVVNQNGTFGPI